MKRIGDGFKSFLGTILWNLLIWGMAPLICLGGFLLLDKLLIHRLGLEIGIVVDSFISVVIVVLMLIYILKRPDLTENTDENEEARQTKV